MTAKLHPFWWFRPPCYDKYGITTKGLSNYIVPANLIIGIWIEATRTINLAGVKVYLTHVVGNVPFLKCALYTHTEAQGWISLIAVTEEWKMIKNFDGFKMFNFPSPPTVLANTKYSLFIWGNASYSLWRRTETNRNRVMESPYNDFPTPRWCLIGNLGFSMYAETETYPC